jgi:hypothetical protein
LFYFRLCPKSYYAICNDKDIAQEKDAEKIASKGVSKVSNKFEYAQYKDVLYEDQVYQATNFTLRVKDGKMRSLKCIKKGLSSVHIKNFIQEDRVSTKPHFSQDQ